MGPFGYFKKCITSHYATFSGRARRSEYWFFVLFNVIITYGLIMLTGGLAIFGLQSDNAMSTGATMLPFLVLIFLAVAFFLPSLAVLVRRLHDTNKSGWMALIGLIPLVNLVLLVFLFTEGTRGPNEYGPDPKSPEEESIQDQLV